MADISFTSDDSVVQAAFEIAETGHDGETRDCQRLDESTPPPYLVHLKLVYDILETVFGNRPPHGTQTRAAAWLHDMLENKKTGITTRKELEGLLTAKGVPSATAKKISGIVQELTYIKSFKTTSSAPDLTTRRYRALVTKGVEQADAIRNASPEAKIVKIADQIAGMIEAVERSGEEYGKAYVEKLRNVCVAASEDPTNPTQTLDPLLDAFFRVTYNSAIDIVRQPLAVRKNKQSDLPLWHLMSFAERAMDGSQHNAHQTLHNEAQEDTKYFCFDPLRCKGIVYVGFDRNKRVNSYGMIVDPALSADDSPNSEWADFWQTLQSHTLETGGRISVNSERLDEDANMHKKMRYFSVTPSVSGKEFIDLAKKITPQNSSAKSDAAGLIGKRLMAKITLQAPSDMVTVGTSGPANAIS